MMLIIAACRAIRRHLSLMPPLTFSPPCRFADIASLRDADMPLPLRCRAADCHYFCRITLRQMPAQRGRKDARGAARRARRCPMSPPPLIEFITPDADAAGFREARIRAQ